MESNGSIYLLKSIVKFLSECVNKRINVFTHSLDSEAAIKSEGIYYEDEEDAFIKRQAVKIAKLVVLLAEHQNMKHQFVVKVLI